MAYTFTAQWLKGADNNAPDTLSRHPVCDPQPADILAERDIHNNPEMSLTEPRAIRHHLRLIAGEYSNIYYRIQVAVYAFLEIHLI